MELGLQRALSFDTFMLWSESNMNIFSFQDHASYLQWLQKNYPGSKRTLSLVRWAKKLGYRSPRSIAMVLKGQRLPTEEMVLAISNDLKLSTEERRYFELLVLKEKYKDKDARLKPILSEIQRLSQNFVERKTLSADIFTYVSEWYYMAIKQLVRTKDFQENPRWIVDRLRGKITEAEAQKALETMLGLEVLARDSKGKIIYNERSDLITPADIPSAAVRKHFRQQMERATEALEEQSLQEREFTGLTLRLSKNRLAEAKNFIREFRDKFANEFEDGESEDICQFNVQVFFHTKEKKNA